MSEEELDRGVVSASTGCLLKQPERFKGQTVVPVVCGKNIGTGLFKSIIARKIDPA